MRAREGGEILPLIDEPPQLLRVRVAWWARSSEGAHDAQEVRSVARGGGMQLLEAVVREGEPDEPLLSVRHGRFPRDPARGNHVAHRLGLNAGATPGASTRHP